MVVAVGVLPHLELELGGEFPRQHGPVPRQTMHQCRLDQDVGVPPGVVSGVGGWVSAVLPVRVRLPCLVQLLLCEVVVCLVQVL